VTRRSGPWVHPGAGVGVATFLGLAFGLAWLPFLAAAAGLHGVGPVLMPVAPAVACIVVRRWVTREGFADAGLRPRVRRHWTVYLLAVVWPVGAAVCTWALTRALHVGTGRSGFPAAPAGGWSVLALWAAMSILISPIVLGEELGWRGYLQLRLFPRHTWAAALATGFLWGIWHYPLILSGGEPTAGTTVTLVALPVSTMTFSVFLGWVRSVTGSVWATSVAHGSNNVTSDNLQRLILTRRDAGSLPDPAVVLSLLGEAMVWGAVIGIHTLRRRQGRAG
jgi:membrane protease YdiL (CAAX protease family)